MNVLHVDWETTGLYLKGEPSENPNHPHVCSVSAILDDSQGRMIQSFYSLIRVPAGTVWEPKAFEANGLTENICAAGLPLSLTMATLMSMAVRAQAFCAFSAYFDLKFLKISAARIGGEQGEKMRATFEGLQRMCTMETSARFLKGDGQRFIKLILAHEQIMGRPFEGAHNALYDNLAQRAIYQKLLEKGVTDFSDTKVLKPEFQTRRPAAAAVEPEPPLAPAKKRTGKPAAIGG